jgi:hypothetical protein
LIFKPILNIFTEKIMRDTTTLNHFGGLHEIAREAWEGNYELVGEHPKERVLYVALALVRMREPAPGDSIADAVDRVGPDLIEQMLTVWKSSTQPKN